jgi:hypothetical protein
MKDKSTNKARVVVRPASDFTPEEARDSRARAWMFVFDCYAKKKGGPATAPDARKESDRSGKTIIPK